MFMFIAGFITGVVVTLVIIFLLGPKILGWFFKKMMNKNIKNMEKTFFDMDSESDEKWRKDDIL
ncbi:MAG: hypothetical protein V5A68_05195 [Candidatus Thermoplasmatota archaeon]